MWEMTTGTRQAAGRRTAGQETTNDTVRQTIVKTIEAPRLEGIQTIDFVDFKRNCEVYSPRVAEKNSAAIVKIPLTSLHNSIEKKMLEMSITSAVSKKRLFDLKLERAARKRTLESQVWDLFLKYGTVLGYLGYDKFKENHPKLAVKHILRCAAKIEYHNSPKRLKPSKSKMEAFQEDNCQPLPALLVDHRRDADHRAVDKEATWVSDDPPPRPGGMKALALAPEYLNPKCKGKSFVNDCPTTSSDEEKKFKAEYMERKRIHQENAAHTGAAAKFISRVTLENIRAADVHLSAKDLKKPMTFRNGGNSSVPLTSDRAMQANVRLGIHHGANFMLCGIKWLICEDISDFVYIDRHVMSSLGLNNQEILAAACGRLQGEVEVPSSLTKDGNQDDALANRLSQPALHGMLRGRGYDLGSTYHSFGVQSMIGWTSQMRT
ncbi:unnamed protein product [Agarophyton chilense]